MRRETLCQAGVLGSIVLGSFLLHSCMAGPRYEDPVRLGEIGSAPKILVGFGKCLRVEAASFSVRGSYAIHSDKGVIDHATGGAPIEVRWDNGLKLGAMTTSEPFLKIIPAADGDLEVNGIRYRGELHIFKDEEKSGGAPRVTFTNFIDLESYLKGVLGSEMSLSQHAEALKAQAIAARTYAMYEVKSRTLRMVKNEKFDVYDDDRSQVYLGLKNETAKAAEIIDATRGMFMVYDGRIFKTFFSSTCGGHTEPAHIVLGREADDIPPLRGTRCGDGTQAYCEGSKHYRWKAELAKKDLVAKLFPDKPQVVIEKIEITRTLPGGHASEVAISLMGTSRKVVLEANGGFRRKADPRIIKSTLWEKIEEDAARVVISGRGWGHACGLCQTGAYRMADLGRGAVQICEHYYPGAKVQKLY